MMRFPEVRAARAMPAAAVLLCPLAANAYAAATSAAAAVHPQPRPAAAAAAGDVTLSGVSCPDAAHCLAVGQVVTTSNPGRDYAQAWNGRAWRVVTPPSPGASPAALNAVACTGPASCVAVGSYATVAGPAHTLALFWNGSSWRVLSTPSPASSELRAIACGRAGHCVAVGDTLQAGAIGTLAETWDGTRWRVLPAAATGSGDSVLRAVSCARADRCMAAGTSFNSGVPGGRTVTLTESWNGTAWHMLPAPSPGTRLSDLEAVSCTTPVNCVATGFYLNIGQPYGTALAETWNGTAWHRVLPKTPGKISSLLAISCPRTGHCMAVGGGGSVPLAEALTMTRWRTVPTASLGKDTGNLLSISCPAINRCVAAGDHFRGNGHTRPLTEQWNGTRWQITSW